MKRLVAICIGMVLLIASPATAITGKQLLSFAKNNDFYSRGYFMGYVQAVAEQYLFLCIPSGVTNGQLAAVVKKYLSEHPEELHLQGNALIERAFKKAWPCE